ncbi:HU family DNA-binding protein [Lutibacter sp.]|uniref:HU family DNA-binding protein n=1 Tax=Lutibacter sp. TaxID=1925666 RepID=UPI0034A00935
MKTTLFLFATLFISTITFSQTSKKGYDYYKASSHTKMNKGELIDAMAKDANNSQKRAARTGRNPQTGKEIKISNKTKAQHNWMNNPSSAGNLNQKSGQTSSKNSRVRPIDGKNEVGKTQSNNLRKRPGRTTYKKMKK